MIKDKSQVMSNAFVSSWMNWKEVVGNDWERETVKGEMTGLVFNVGDGVPCPVAVSLGC